MIACTYCKLGETVTFEGYADDYGKHVAAVEFSLDGGESWAVCDTSNSTADLTVQWRYAFVPKEPGRYQLRVRSVSDDGRRSPLSAIAELCVTE